MTPPTGKNNWCRPRKWALAMLEPTGRDSTESIRKRIDAAKEEQSPTSSQFKAASQAHVAWRMVVDLVAGVGIGAAMGFGLDALFGTTPLMLATLTLLGFAGGVNLMLRTAKEVNKENGPQSGTDG